MKTSVPTLSTVAAIVTLSLASFGEAAGVDRVVERGALTDMTGSNTTTAIFSLSGKQEIASTNISSLVNSLTSKKFTDSTSIETPMGNKHLVQILKESEGLLGLARTGRQISLDELERGSLGKPQFAATHALLHIAIRRANSEMAKMVDQSVNLDGDISLASLLKETERFHHLVQAKGGIVGQPTYDSSAGINPVLMGILDTFTPQIAQSRKAPLLQNIMVLTAPYRGGLISEVSSDSKSAEVISSLLASGAAAQNRQIVLPKTINSVALISFLKELFN